MKRILGTVFISILFSSFLFAQTVKNPVVQMSTNKGDIFIELFINEAPKTVENFLKYVEDGFYDDTIFHRVINNFVIQGGGFDALMAPKKTRGEIENEAHNKLSNSLGTIAMARTSEVNSATSQFFINLSDNAYLDHRNKSQMGYGYCVFGKVIKGLNVVKVIGGVSTTNSGVYQNVPVDNIVIKDVVLIRDIAKK